MLNSYGNIHFFAIFYDFLCEYCPFFATLNGEHSILLIIHFLRAIMSKTSSAKASFQRLVDFFSKIPSVQADNILAYAYEQEHIWWFKFKINIEHPLAWQTVQELGHVLNYLSVNERLPTQFMPVSPPPYMNGDAKQFLAWVIECNHADFPPDVVCDWLEGRLPNPIDDETQWGIGGDLSMLDDLSAQDIDQLIPPLDTIKFK